MIFLFLWSSTAVRAQPTEEERALALVFAEQLPTADFSGETINVSNEYTFLLGQFFLFYKRFISSQDSGACAFHPSCSVYAIRSVRRFGIFSGLVRAFDRLLRCNPWAADYYPFHMESRRLYDPVAE